MVETAELKLYKNFCTLTRYTHQQATSWRSLAMSKDHTIWKMLPTSQSLSVLHHPKVGQHDFTFRGTWPWKASGVLEVKLMQPDPLRSGPGSSQPLKATTPISKKRGSRDSHSSVLCSSFCVINHPFRDTIHFRTHWHRSNYWVVFNMLSSSWPKPWYSPTTGI